MTANLIPLRQAIDMTRLYRSEKENILTEEHRDTGKLPICETFEKAAFQQLLETNECVGVRIYSGMDSNRKMRFIIVGVDSRGEDLYITQTDSEQLVIEAGIRCPSVCPPASVLNS